MSRKSNVKLPCKIGELMPDTVFTLIVALCAYTSFDGVLYINAKFELTFWRKMGEILCVNRINVKVV